MTNQTIPWWNKLTLTIKEAAEYSGIGESTLRDRVKDNDFDFLLKIGTKTVIKRRLFEKYVEEIDVI